METGLLVIHYLSFVVGAGGSFVAVLAYREIDRRPPAEAAVLRAFLKKVADASLVALILLWVSGIAVALMRYGGFSGLGWAFSVKMVWVVALTLVVAAMRVQMIRAGRGVASAPAMLRRLGPWTMVTSWLAIVFAVIAFG